MRADVLRRLRNLHVKSELKTLMRRFSAAVQAASKEQAQAAYRLLAGRLDQAASKRALHRKTASRKKSRLARMLAKLR